MRNLLSVAVVLLALVASGCGSAPIVVARPDTGAVQLCPSSYDAITFHNVPVINESKDGCPARVDLITTPAAVMFRRAPEEFIEASNMSRERWVRLGFQNQRTALELCRFESPIFNLEPFGAVALQVPHPRWGPEDIEIQMSCSAIPGTGCYGQDVDSVRLRANRHDSRPFWQDGETRELRCQNIRKIRRR